MQQIGADGRQCESALGGARCALRVGHFGVDVARELLGGRALHHLLRVQVETQDGVRERDAVRVARASGEVPQPAHPAQRLRGRLGQWPTRGVERARFAGGEARRDEQPRGHRRVEHAVHRLAQRHLAQDAVGFLREGA